MVKLSSFAEQSVARESRNNINVDIEADLTNLQSRYSPKTQNETNVKMKAEEGVKACERRLVENKASTKEIQKKFSELMSHDDNIGFKELENKIARVNRMNGVNNKLVKETRELRK